MKNLLLANRFCIFEYKTTEQTHFSMVQSPKDSKLMKFPKAFLLFFVLVGFSCTQANEEKSSQKKEPKPEQIQATTVSNQKEYKGSLPIDRIKLPKGFKINIFAENVDNARSLALGEKTVFVGNRQGNKVFGLQDLDKDGVAENKFVIAKGLEMPNGVAFRKGDLYVAEVSRILRFADIEANLKTPPKPEIINSEFPSDFHHGWKFIAFSPDDKLYVPVGAPCNVCLKNNKIYSSITRMNPDGSDLEVFAKGVRNSVGFDWHPETKELWFTDNGRDMMGDDLPSDELNHAPKAGMHFGFPFCHQGDTPDPEFGKQRNCNEFAPPSQKLGAHVAALGMRFYTGNTFPKKYKNAIFIAQHGSWNRSSKVGYKIMVAFLEGNKVVGYEEFATGWLEGEKAWGRPVDIQPLEDGSILISDDYANAVYRVWYEGI
jgi:glucose/arabinose dehydrogenase